MDKGDEQENDTVIENLNIMKVDANEEGVGDEDDDGEAADDEDDDSIDDLVHELEELIKNQSQAFIP